ncbi:hypothetical protein PAMP_002174 [Pampus punctatissimus]
MKKLSSGHSWWKAVTAGEVTSKSLILVVYNNYPEDLGAALYREPFDFNAEPPWDPS